MLNVKDPILENLRISYDFYLYGDESLLELLHTIHYSIRFNKAKALDNFKAKIQPIIEEFKEDIWKLNE